MNAKIVLGVILLIIAVGSGCYSCLSLQDTPDEGVFVMDARGGRRISPEKAAEAFRLLEIGGYDVAEARKKFEKDQEEKQARGKMKQVLLVSVPAVTGLLGMWTLAMGIIGYLDRRRQSIEKAAPPDPPKT
jgi:hypothetical protein